LLSLNSQKKEVSFLSPERKNPVILVEAAKKVLFPALVGPNGKILNI
jgi:hypothetical protein